MFDFSTLNAELAEDFLSDSGAEGIDIDGDGAVDMYLADCDGDGNVDMYLYDSDGDGFCDTCCADTDGDGSIDAELYFVDTDGDGTFDAAAGLADADGDGTGETYFRLNDYDQDGSYENVRFYTDTDGDGTFDVMGKIIDTDGDEEFDSVEVYADTDGDGESDKVMEISVADDNIDDESDGESDGENDKDSDCTGDSDDTSDSESDKCDESEESEESFEDGVSDPVSATVLSELEQFDPDEADDADITGDPESSMEVWECQGDTNRCALYSQKFVIEELTGEDIDIEEFADLAEENGWFSEEGGTAFLNMNKMLDYYGIDNEMSFNNDFSDIEECLENGGKVIVSIDADEIWYGEDENLFDPADSANHAVEVIGIDYSDPDNPMVILNDSGPGTGQGEMIPLDTFMDAWEDGDYQMITCR